jgi:hypothetical protein
MANPSSRLATKLCQRKDSSDGDAPRAVTPTQSQRADQAIEEAEGLLHLNPGLVDQKNFTMY